MKRCMKQGGWIVLLLTSVFWGFIGCSSLERNQTTKEERKAEDSKTEKIRTSKRLALVIGNQNYKRSPLTNPINDADDMEDLLVKMDFKVIKKLNVGQKEMEDAIRDFGKQLDNFDVGLFYFSGHGMQCNGENYLLPIEEIYKYTDVKYKAVSAGMVLDEMKASKKRLNIIILDACRVNLPMNSGEKSPFKGLASMSAPTGSLIAFATAPNSVARESAGRNSVFTGGLLRHIVPCSKVEDILKNVRKEVMEQTSEEQVPWENSSLIGDFYFRECISQPEINDILTFVGSNTLGEKLVPSLAESFMEDELGAKNVSKTPDPKDHEVIYVTGDVEGKKQRIMITAKGSGDAFKAESGGLTAEHPCDIGMSSRPVKDSEGRELVKRYGEWKSSQGKFQGEGMMHTVAMDGIAVIVNPSNPIKSLTIDELRRIYSMAITDWKDVNSDSLHGKTGKIQVYCRAKPSGTRDFFLEKIRLPEGCNQAIQETSSGTLAEKVSKDQNAIGFVSESYADSARVKVLDISLSTLEKSIPCERENIRNESYPFSRPLFFYTALKPQNEEMVRKFLRFALKDDTQQKVVNQKARLISVSGTKYQLHEPQNEAVVKPIEYPPGSNIILRLYGSDTIGEELAVRLAKLYLKENGASDERIKEDGTQAEKTPDGDAKIFLVSADITRDGKPEVIEIRPRKSSFGFESLAKGNCDIAMSSDEISKYYEDMLEKENIRGMRGTQAQFAIAYDAIAVVVNHSNPLRNISLSELRDIFTEKITKWNTVGGDNLPITVYSRPKGSGTRQFFTKKALNEAEIGRNAKIISSNPGIASAISDDAGGIAYLPYAEAKKQGLTLIAVGEGERRYEPNPLTVASSDIYPIKRTLYLYIPPSEQALKESQKHNYGHVKKFVRMAQDLNKGQKEVENATFFPITSASPVPKHGELFCTVYFDSNRAVLETDSEHKIDNSLLKFVMDNPSWRNAGFTVIGYSDIIGSHEICERKATERALAVKRFLEQKGLRVVEAKSGGISNLNKVSLPASSHLLREDRRVEIKVAP